MRTVRLVLSLLALFTIVIVMSDKSDAHEVLFRAKGPQGPLEGAFVDAGVENAPTVLIVPGSGPTDRDGNSPLGVTAATYRYLAEDLAAAGINSLRIDKRGLHGSAAAISDPNKVVLADYASDVATWVELLATSSISKCIWVLGHSEGGLVAMLSTSLDVEICGIILATTPGRRTADLLRVQLKNNPANAPVLEDAFAAIDLLEAGSPVDVSGFHPALQQLFDPSLQDYWIDLMKHDPSEMIAAVDLPILILHGQRDLQVFDEDAERLSAAQPKARTVLLETANHVLKEVQSDDPAENYATYANPDLPLHPGVVKAISGFLKDAKQ